ARSISIDASGGGGNDLLIGSFLNDTLRGGAGSDTLVGGGGFDVFAHGFGEDALPNTIADFDTDDQILFQSEFDIGDVTAVQNVNPTTGDVTTTLAIDTNQDGFTDARYTLQGAYAVNQFLAEATTDFEGQAATRIRYVGAASQQVTGGEGSDVLAGIDSANVLDAGGGADTLIGSDGADTLRGGDGVDVVNYLAAESGIVVRLWNGTAENDIAEGDRLSGIETVIGSRFDDTLSGSSNADRLDGDAGADGLYGGFGDDTLTGGVGGDTISGGEGVDTASYAAATEGVRLQLWSGQGLAGEAAGDTLSGVENVLGSDFADTVSGDGFANAIDAGDGDDAVYASGGDDAVDGGAGADSLFGQSGDDTLVGGDGDDELRGGAGADLLNGGDGFDTASYSDAGAAVRLQLWSNSGLAGDAAGDQLAGIEQIIGSRFNDTVAGSDNGESLIGREGDDAFYGGGGDDTFNGGEGADILNGGAGVDTIVYADATAGVRLQLWSGAGLVGEAAGDRFASIENVIGGAGDDTIAGNDVANKVETGEGDDAIYTGGGDDTLEGGLGADILNGGDGFDVVVYDDASAGVRVQLWSGSGLAGEAAGDRLGGVEGVIGSDFDDSLSGSAGGDLLDGRGGDDAIYAGAGEDTINGGAGDDFLSGGGDNDIFVFAPGTDDDLIADFSSGAGAGDVVDLSAFGTAFDSFAEILDRMVEIGDDVVLDLGDGDTLTFANKTLADFAADDFGF
ncbi:MAG: calcium-binding protein, partial [Pseudomonadota bacterium]